MNFIVGWAFEHGKLPSEALELERQHPNDFRLLKAWAVYRAEREQEETEKAEKKAKSKP